MTTHSERCYKECTRDVIFLLQVRQSHWTEKVPEDCHYSDSLIFRDDDKEHENPLSADEVHEIDPDCVILSWYTDSVWLDRDEAEAYAESRSYNYGKKGKGWQVYGVCADGELAKMLRGKDKV